MLSSSIKYCSNVNRVTFTFKLIITDQDSGSDRPDTVLVEPSSSVRWHKSRSGRWATSDSSEADRRSWNDDVGFQAPIAPNESFESSQDDYASSSVYISFLTR